MTLRSIAAAGLFLIPAIFASSAWADRVHVEMATGTGVSTEDLATATELIRTSISEVSRHDVLLEASGADFILRPKLMRLGEAYILSLSKVRGAEILYASQLKALRMDELDKVAQRLTRSVLDGQKAASDVRVGEVTNHEALEGRQRRPARLAAHAGFGGATFRNLNTSGVGYSIGASYGWDINQARIKFIGDGSLDHNAFFISGGLGANYYFSMTDIAPYLSADFGAGAAKLNATDIISGETVAGFVFGVGGGIEFLRTHEVSADLDLRAGYLLRSNQLGTPQVLTLRLGIYY